MICQQMEDYVKKRNQRIFVHCHAGQGRTGIICASYLYYAGIANSADHAIKLFKEQRLSSGALKRTRDKECVA
jgi:protein-tyrosine phosphatase